MTFDCEYCHYLIEYLDEDKWGSSCVYCGRSFEELKKLEENYWRELTSVAQKREQ